MDLLQMPESLQSKPEINFEVLPILQNLYKPFRYKVLFGGRGGSKSWGIARALIMFAHTGKERIGCFRELQSSIRESVHHLLTEQIQLMGLGGFFHITDTAIRGKVMGSEFIFKGLHHNIVEIKSLEGLTKAWVEEAQLVSKLSWETLIPTIRKEGSEIWASFNPISDTDDTYRRFVLETPPGAWVQKVSWRDNKYFTRTQNAERLWMKQSDPDAYEHVWEGECSKLSDDVIFRNRWVVESFDPPDYPAQVEFKYGSDFGFAQDPTVLCRCWITGEPPYEELWIDREAWKIGCEIDKTPELYDEIPGSREWPIKADNARPETISYLHRQGFNISAAEKWPGCVEDRIAHIKGYKMIHIHASCKHFQEEARLYRYKRDRITGEVLPIVIDKSNHCIAGGQLVTTDQGEVPIEKISVGDYVLTRVGFKRVIQAIRRPGEHPIWELSSSHNHLRATPDHEVFTANRGLVRLDSLDKDDNLVTTGFLHAPVRYARYTGSTEPVYDLTVEDQHEFFASGILVSNCWDALGYALDGYIQRRGYDSVWERL